MLLTLISLFIQMTSAPVLAEHTGGIAAPAAPSNNAILSQKEKDCQKALAELKDILSIHKKYFFGSRDTNEILQAVLKDAGQAVTGASSLSSGSRAATSALSAAPTTGIGGSSKTRVATQTGPTATSVGSSAIGSLMIYNAWNNARTSYLRTDKERRADLMKRSHEVFKDKKRAEDVAFDIIAGQTVAKVFEGSTSLPEPAKELIRSLNMRENELRQSVLTEFQANPFVPTILSVMAADELLEQFQGKNNFCD